MSNKKTLGQIIQQKQLPGFKYKPTPELYQATGINQKRFGMLLKGKIRPYADELTAIANFLKIEIDTKELF